MSEAETFPKEAAVIEKYASGLNLDPKTATVLDLRQRLGSMDVDGMVNRADLRRQIHRELGNAPGAAVFSIPFLEET